MYARAKERQHTRRELEMASIRLRGSDGKKEQGRVSSIKLVTDEIDGSGASKTDCRARMNSSTVFGSQSGALAGMRIRLGTAQSPRDMILGHWKCDYAYINDVVFSISISISISLLFFIILYFHCYLLFVLLRNVSKQLLLLLLLLALVY